MDLKKERNVQMTVLTIFATVLVVAGHCDITPDYKNLWIFKWVYSFHMPLFFFISGYLFCLTNPEKRLNSTTWKDFLRKKFLRLLIPFFVISSIIFIIKASLFSDGTLVQHPVELSFDSYINSLFLEPLGFLWFLPALFMSFVMVFPIWKLLIGKSKNILLIVTLIVYLVASISTSINYEIVNFMQLRKALYFFAFFWSGILYCKYSVSVNAFINHYWIPIEILSGLSSFFLIGNKYILAVSGIIFSSTLALLVSDYIPKSILKLGIFTYSIFLLSYFPQMFVRGPIHVYLSSVNQYWLSGLSFVIGLTIPIIFVIAYKKLTMNNPFLKKVGIVFGI